MLLGTFQQNFHNEIPDAFQKMLLAEKVQLLEGNCKASNIREGGGAHVRRMLKGAQFSLSNEG